MQTWSNTDKSAWPHGQWSGEPDKAHWIDAATGLDCLIVRGPHGALCGYVGVPQSHACFKKEYDDADVSVHGGLTFADLCQPSGDESRHICHPAKGAANETVWWLGFDCAHSGDLSPKYSSEYYASHGVYRDFDYVKQEVESLASQLSVLA